MEDIIRFLNHWWREGKVREGLAKDYRREQFDELARLTERRQCVVICGLRRVGKTTLMYQLIQKLISAGTDPLNILYFSFDKKVGEIKEVLDLYTKVTEKDYEKEKLFVFLDEVYKLKEWHKELKMLYDAIPNIKFIVSGSASLKVEKEARKDLVGRAFYIELKPLSFKEFLELKFKTEIRNIKVWEDKLKNNFFPFLRKPFPEVIGFREDEVVEYIKELVLDKVIFSDFPETFHNVDIHLLQTLTEIFYSEPGMYLNIDSLAKDLKKSKNDILFHIKLLELGYIIRIVKNYRGSKLSVSRKLRRVYPYHPCLVQGIYKRLSEPKMVEGFIRTLLGAELYWRKNKKEVDFVYNGLPIEVKYRERISNRDFKNLTEFMDIFGVKKAYLISKNNFDEIEINNKNIKVVPAWHFAITFEPSANNFRVN